MAPSESGGGGLLTLRPCIWIMLAQNSCAKYSFEIGFCPFLSPVSVSSSEAPRKKRVAQSSVGWFQVNGGVGGTGVCVSKYTAVHYSVCT